MGAPGEEHERLVALLETLAQLTGHKLAVPPRLPGGARPDVLGFGRGRQSLFTADAKSSESYEDAAPRERLAVYATWQAAHARGGRPGFMLVACADPAWALGWADVVEAELAGRAPRWRRVRARLDRRSYLCGCAWPATG